MAYNKLFIEEQTPLLKKMIKGKKYLIINNNYLNEKSILDYNNKSFSIHKNKEKVFIKKTNELKNFSTNNLLPEGIYYEGKILLAKYNMKDNENIIDVAKKYNISPEYLQKLNPKYDPAINFLVNENIQFKIPAYYKNKETFYSGFFLGKLKHNFEDKIENTILTFIINNGNQLDLFLDYYENKIKNILNFKNHEYKKIGKNKIKIYTTNEIKQLWTIVYNLRNNYSPRKKNLDFVINYDFFFETKEYKETTNLTEYLIALKKYKIKLKKQAQIKLKEKIILNCYNSKPKITLEEIIEYTNFSESFIRKTLKNNNIIIFHTDKKLNKVIVEYNIMLKHNLSPSYQSIVENTGITLNTVKKALQGLKIYSHIEYKKSYEVERIKYNNYFNYKPNNKIKKELIDEDFFGYDINDSIVNKMESVANKQIQDDINREKKERINYDEYDKQKQKELIKNNYKKIEKDINKNKLYQYLLGEL